MKYLPPLVIANWKMNPQTRRAAEALARAVGRAARGARGVRVAVAPPFPFLAAVGARAKPAALAAQDVFWERAGPYTGEVSPAMLRDAGVRYAIVGHSERRRLLAEDDAAVNRKVRALIAAGITPVIAVGEGLEESRAVVPRALADGLARALVGVAPRQAGRIVIAYEPVWAISTASGGQADTPAHATSRAIYLRKLLARMLGRRSADAVRIIYGGSVSARNAADYLARDIRGMEGLLVGAASLDAKEFAAILRAVAVRHR